MTVGYNSRCKICNCEFRDQVESLHESGMSLQQIADFLAKNGIKVAKSSVKNHFDTHFAPKTEAAQRYHEASQKVMEQAVDKRLTDLEMLDEVIRRNYELHQGATESIKESLTKEHPVILKSGKPLLDSKTYEPVMRKYAPAKPVVDLLNGTSSEIRQALKTKHDLLGDGEDNKPTRVVIVDDLDDIDEED